MNLAAPLGCPSATGRSPSLHEPRGTFSRDGGVYDVTSVPPPDAEVQARWGPWQLLQATARRPVRSTRRRACRLASARTRPRSRQFASLEGKVLDVSCGSQTMPLTRWRCPASWSGIDPLIGVQPREVAFVKGIAEYLPFANGAFDRVLFATPLDHVLSPSLTPTEARRVTKPGDAIVGVSQ
jgi:hypothetical protein